MAGGYDYIVIGGGSSGCVLASRLTEDPSCRVLLLESGLKDSHPLLHIPVGYVKMNALPFASMTTGALTWGLVTAPQKHANNRALPYTQARVIGGGSSINAAVYTRGTRADYDRWAQEHGCDGWSFDEVMPYFLRSEGNTALSDAWHGTAGPLGVSNVISPQPMTRAFVEACQQLGIPHTADFNGETQQGAGIYQTTTRNAKRCSAAVAYLRPALNRANLTVRTGCTVRRIVIENARATGVDFTDRAGTHTARATSEVLLTAGAIGSPKLMMLSGLGPAADLRGHGIEVVQDLPGVGQNLADHYAIDIVAELNGDKSLNRYRKTHLAAWAAIQYYLAGTGPLTSNVVEGGAFWFSREGQGQPDLQFHFLPGAGAEPGVPSVRKGAAGITLNSYALQPKARGTVRLRSANPSDTPIVDPDFLGHPDDLRTSVEGIRMSVDIFEQEALRQHIRKISFPDESLRTEAGLAEYARQYGRTSYHPTGTCKMGHDALAVVDPQLRVRGIDGLRICDSSIMPSLVSSNTNAPTIMIGEKAADLVRGNR